MATKECSILFSPKMYLEPTGQQHHRHDSRHSPAHCQEAPIFIPIISMRSQTTTKCQYQRRFRQMELFFALGPACGNRSISQACVGAALSGEDMVDRALLLVRKMTSDPNMAPRRKSFALAQKVTAVSIIAMALSRTHVANTTINITRDEMGANRAACSPTVLSIVALSHEMGENPRDRDVRRCVLVDPCQPRATGC